MYPKTGPTVDAPIELAVDATNARLPQSASSARPIYSPLRVTKAGRHVIDTRGPTDVVMTLFGPDNPTALIAEDDDSGYGSNARIAASLIEGRYFVQVRHFNRANGMGNYTVRVSRV